LQSFVALNGTEAPVSKPLVFLSYKHGERWTELAQRLHLRLSTVAEGMGFDLFMDSEIDASEEWRKAVEKKLARTTHFICMLCDEYWVSPECQRELSCAVQRYRDTRKPKLLFVLAETMSPQYLKFRPSGGGNGSGGGNELVPPKNANAEIEKVSDLNFLGPFDKNSRLVALAKPNEGLSEQLYQMVERLRATLPKPGH
jgi:hypothetical protein